MAKNSKIIKPTILCLSDFYLPDFRSGGLVRSIYNFVELLGDDFNIKIICRGANTQDIKLYKRIKPYSWNVVGKAKVYYVSNENLKTFFIINLIRQTSHDILYLNSIFSFKFSILPLLTRFFSHNLNQPCVISPRGELSEQALLLKKYKKFLFIKFCRLIKLHDNLIWLAGRNVEHLDIYKVFNKLVNRSKIIPDLFLLKAIPKKMIPKQKSKILRIVFLSRISPIKNLDFLLSVLLKVSVDCQLDIFGPITDKKYWKKCKNLIYKLPDNVRINIGKEIKPHKIQKLFLKYDVFAFPTKGESFGHVIFESLSSSTPVLVSNKTIWKSDKKKGIVALPLTEERWILEINKLAILNNKQFYNRRKAALDLVKKTKSNLKDKKKLYKNFFLNIVKKL